MDSAQYAIYKIANSRNESLKKDQIISMVRGIAGYSVFLLREWLENAENSTSYCNIRFNRDINSPETDKVERNARKFF